MSYIPVGTTLTYTCKFNATTGHLGSVVFTNWSQIVSRLSNDLKNELPGAEEFDVTSSDGSNNYLSGDSTFTMQVLNNGVDHADENDIKSIIDGTIQGYGVTIISSSIPGFTLPNNPGDDTQAGQTVSTGQASNQPLPSKGILDSIGLGGNINLTPSLSTKFLTTGTVIIIAIVALVLLLPKGALSLARGVRR